MPDDTTFYLCSVLNLDTNNNKNPTIRDDKSPFFHGFANKTLAQRRLRTMSCLLTSCHQCMLIANHDGNIRPLGRAVPSIHEKQTVEARCNNKRGKFPMSSENVLFVRDSSHRPRASTSLASNIMTANKHITKNITLIPMIV
jgi:hypothetical protein